MSSRSIDGIGVVQILLLILAELAYIFAIESVQWFWLWLLLLDVIANAGLIASAAIYHIILPIYIHYTHFWSTPLTTVVGISPVFAGTAVVVVVAASP